MMLIWKPKAEQKCKIFAWTLILTANNLMKQQWPHDPICKLCGSNPKTPTHLCKDCVFSKQVWETLKQCFGLATIDTVRTEGSLHNYWRICRSKIESKQRKDFDSILIYYWWNIGKDRNCRTFQNISLQPRQVAFLCKEDTEQYQLATRSNAQAV